MAYHSVTINITNKYLHTTTKFVSKSAILMFNEYEFTLTTSTRVVPGTNDFMKMVPQGWLGQTNLSQCYLRAISGTENSFRGFEDAISMD